MELKHNRHPFLSCLNTRMVSKCIKFVWISLSAVKLSSFNWGFAHMENSGVMPHFQINFESLRYWVLWFNCIMWNVFTFDLQIEVRKYVVVQRTSLVAIESVREVTQSEPQGSQLCKVTCKHNKHLNWCFFFCNERHYVFRGGEGKTQREREIEREGERVSLPLPKAKVN